MATPPVYYFNSGMRGAPVLAGQAGSLIALLDACLITGFGLVSASAVNVASGVATATIPSGTPFDIDSNILVAGATDAAINGTFRVSATSATTVSWPTTAANGAAAGTITIKVAPVIGWTKPFTGTNLAVYKSTDPQSYGMYVWVDDTNALYARVVGYESMSDVNTGTGPFPTSAQQSGGGYWLKSNTANSNPIDWVVSADARFFMHHMSTGQGSQTTEPGRGNARTAMLRGFGDPVAYRNSGDPWCSILAPATSSSTTDSTGIIDGGNVNNIYSPRDVSGVGSAIASKIQPYIGSGTQVSGLDSTCGAFPSPIDGSLQLSYRYVNQTTGANQNAPRAQIPGVLSSPQSGLNSFFVSRDVVPGTGALAGRRLVALSGGGTSPGTAIASAGVSFVDVTGPWR